MPLSADIVASIQAYNKIINDNKVPNTNLGVNWLEIGEKLTTILTIALGVPLNWKRGATFREIIFSNEYDFQNFVEQVIKPWLPSIEKDANIVSSTLIFESNGA